MTNQTYDIYIKLENSEPLNFNTLPYLVYDALPHLQESLEKGERPPTICAKSNRNEVFFTQCKPHDPADALNIEILDT